MRAKDRLDDIDWNNPTQSGMTFKPVGLDEGDKEAESIFRLATNFKIGQISDPNIPVDVVFTLDNKHFIISNNPLEGNNINAQCGQLKEHCFIKIRITNDSSSESRNLVLGFCPLRYKFDEKFRYLCKLIFVMPYLNGISLERMKEKTHKYKIMVCSDNFNTLVLNRLHTFRASQEITKICVDNSLCGDTMSLDLDIYPFLLWMSIKEQVFIDNDVPVTKTYAKNCRINSCKDCDWVLERTKLPDIDVRDKMLKIGNFGTKQDFEQFMKKYINKATYHINTQKEKLK